MDLTKLARLFKETQNFKEPSKVARDEKEEEIKILDEMCSVKKARNLGKHLLHLTEDKFDKSGLGPNTSRT